MLKIKYGDLLEASEDVICHQCNTEGVFGGGLAAQIAKKYPDCAYFTEMFAETFGPDDVLGMVHYYPLKDKSMTICNCFTQNQDFTTNYEMLEKAFREILTICKEHNQSVAVPYLYGCGIAKGDWNRVLDIFTSLSSEIGIDISIYCLKIKDSDNNAINS